LRALGPDLNFWPTSISGEAGFPRPLPRWNLARRRRGAGDRFDSIRMVPQIGGPACLLEQHRKPQTRSIGGGCHRLPVVVNGGCGPSLVEVEGRLWDLMWDCLATYGRLPAIPEQNCPAYGAMLWRLAAGTSGSRSVAMAVDAAMAVRRARVAVP
jgi:hypothetical protein